MPIPRVYSLGRRFSSAVLTGRSRTGQNRGVGARMILSDSFRLTPPSGAGAGARERDLLPGAVPGVSTRLVSLSGPARRADEAAADQDAVFLFLEGSGRLSARDGAFATDVEGESLARLPVGWPVA